MPEPIRIEQNISGDHNVVTATGDVNISYAFAAIDDAYELEGLRLLREDVKRTWIDDWLRGIISGQTELTPSCLFRPDLLEEPWAAERPALRPTPVPEGKDIDLVFTEGRRALLILGDPGTGKTILLLRLASALLESSRAQPLTPVPVFLHLSTWVPRYRTLESWLVSELRSKYRIHRKTGASWLRKRRLILLLDGLDEVKAEHRPSCVRAINQFVQDFGLPGLAVTCRSDEYVSMPTRLRLSSAIQVQPLTAEEVDRWLHAGRRDVTLGNDPALRELARNPLMLRILGEEKTALPPNTEHWTEDDWRTYLLESYIRRRLQQRPATGPGYANEQIRSCLRSLAANMLRDGQKTFLIEELQPSWLRGPMARGAYALVTRLAVAAVVSIGFGLLYWISRYFSLQYRLTTMDTKAAEMAGIFFAFFATGAVFGVAAWVRLEYHLRRMGRDPAGTGRAWPFGVPVMLGVWAVGLAILSLLTSLPANNLQTPFVESLKGAVSGPLIYLFWRWLRGFSEQPGKVVLRRLGSFVLPVLFGTVLGFLSSLTIQNSDEKTNEVLGGVIVGVLIALFARLARNPGGDIQTAETLFWSWRGALTWAAFWLALAMVIVFGLIFQGRFRAAMWPAYLRYGWSIALSFAVLGFILGGLRKKVVPSKWRPNEGMRLTLRSAVLVATAGAFAGVVMCVILEAGILSLQGRYLFSQDWRFVLRMAGVEMPGFALFCALMAGLWRGGFDLEKHYVLRFLLTRQQVMPPSLRVFLDYCAKLTLLQRAGGGYTFLHTAVMEHLVNAPVGRSGT